MSPFAVLPALAGGLTVWALLFHTEIARAISVWNASTTYSHCWFVLPVAAWLAWDRRRAAAGIAVRPVLWPALLALPGLAVWLAAERTGIMEVRQLAAVGFAGLLFLAVLGERLAWVFSAALLYLVFLVPFGAFLTPALQRFTVGFTDIGLGLLGIPAYIDQLTIEIPEGTFYVAEACAGLRFLIAAIAFGVLYACLIYRSLWRRAAFIAACCVIPVIANGFRALGIVVVGHLAGSAEAGAADHLIYGWIFFSVVILLLVLAGLPFREDAMPAAPPPPLPPAGPQPAGARASWQAAAALLGIAAIGPAVAAMLDIRAAAPRAVALPSFLPGPGCTAAGAPAADVQRFTCGDFALTATVRLFPPRATPGALIAAQRGAGAEDGAGESVVSRLTGDHVVPRSWRLAETQQPDRTTASMLWIDGDPALEGLPGRLRQARNSLFGSDHAPVLMAVSVAPGDAAPMDRQQQRAAQQLIRAFLETQGDLQAQAVRLARQAAQ